MKIHFLGTAAGRVAVGERRHTSFVIEVNDGNYWFDAGEGCTQAAHQGGVGLLATRAIFITNMGMDHIAGLPRLLWTLRKLNLNDPARPLRDYCIELHLPYALAWSGIVEMLEVTTNNAFAHDFMLGISEYREGKIYTDANVTVTAVHNSHCGTPTRDHDWRSYGLRLGNGRQSVVYTGDVENLEEITPLVSEPCSLLLVDSSHQPIEAICAYLRDSGADYKRLGLVHLSSDIIENPGRAREAVMDILGCEPDIFADGQCLEIVD